MKQIILPVTIHLNIRLPLALLQPESASPVPSRATHLESKYLRLR